MPHPPRALTEEEVKASRVIPATEIVIPEAARTLGIPEGEISREAFHDAVVEHWLSQGDPRIGKEAFFVAGPIGAGKSTLRAKYGPNLKGRVVIDGDAVRELFSRYWEMVRAGHPEPAFMTQPEVAQINKRIFEEAVNRGLPIVWDAMHQNPENILLKPLKDAGYEVKGMGELKPWRA